MPGRKTPPPTIPERMWTRQQIADLMQVSLSTVDRWIHDRELDSHVFGRTRRVPDSALQDWKHRRMEPAADNARRPGRPKAGNAA